jgi:hypothetical protein
VTDPFDNPKVRHLALLAATIAGPLAANVNDTHAFLGGDGEELRFTIAKVAVLLAEDIFLAAEMSQDDDPEVRASLSLLHRRPSGPHPG